MPIRIALMLLPVLAAGCGGGPRDEWVDTGPTRKLTPAEKISATGVTERAKKVGDRAPVFALPDAQGVTVRLTELLARGPVVVTWYRGEWCPYCNRHLAELQARRAEFDAAGATIVAISTQMPERTAATARKNSATYFMLSDVGGRVAEAYGVKFTMPEDMLEEYRGYGIELKDYNGPAGADSLPLSATYVIDRSGIIRYAHVEADYTQRAGPEELLRVLAGLR